MNLFQCGSNEKHFPPIQIFYNPNLKQLMMRIKMEQVGCYQATVSYGDINLKNGDFNILVLSSECKVEVFVTWNNLVFNVTYLNFMLHTVNVIRCKKQVERMSSCGLVSLVSQVMSHTKLIVSGILNCWITLSKLFF